MTKHQPQLGLLGYLGEDELLGDVHVYDLSAAACDEWDALTGELEKIKGTEARLPYAGLATALRAIAKSSVDFDPIGTRAPSMLISRVRLSPEDLHDAITIWEQVVLGVPERDIRLSYTSRVADHISRTKPKLSALAKHIARAANQIDAPGWVWRAATWELAQRVMHASSPLVIDGRSVELRADTQGNLVVWDPTLHWVVEKSAGPAFRACLRVDLKMITFPYMARPVLLVDPHISRLTAWPNFAGRGWQAPRVDSAPLLCIDFEKGRLEASSQMALRIFAKLRGQRAAIRSSEFDLSDPQSSIRALIPESRRFAIGTGVGMHLLRELHAHLTSTVGLQPIRAYAVRGHRFSKSATRKLKNGRDAELLDPQHLPDVLKAAGIEKLRILVLYTTQRTRARLQSLLAFQFARPDVADQGIADGSLLSIGAGVELLFQPARELLSHGPHGERAQHAARLHGLDAARGTRIVALCETDYDADEWSEKRRLSRKNGSDVVDPYTMDAKPKVNRLLAERGVAAQFIVDRDMSVNTRDVQTKPGKDADVLTLLGDEVSSDHAGHNAISDVLRVAGLVPPRLTPALSYGPHGVRERLAYVGLHVRQQERDEKTGRRRLAWALVALLPDGPKGPNWRAKAYVAKAYPAHGKSGWQDYTEANLAFRALPYPEGARKDAELLDAVDAALGQLRHELRGTTGYVLFVSGDSGARSAWPGLANKNLGSTPDRRGRVNGQQLLPGIACSPTTRPRAVVRASSDTEKLPRPVCVFTPVKAGVRASPLIKNTSRGLFRLDGARDTWLLSRVPRQFDGASIHSRIGNDRSRWTASPSEQRKVWYAHTVTEIAVISHDGPAEMYAVAAARLCQHALYWDGRTKYPAPVHMAIQMDKNHPDYRRADDSGDS